MQDNEEIKGKGKEKVDPIVYEQFAVGLLAQKDYDITLKVKGTKTTIIYKQVLDEVSKEEFDKLYNSLANVLKEKVLAKLNQSDDIKNGVLRNFRKQYKNGKGTLIYKIDTKSIEEGFVIIFTEALEMLVEYLGKEKVSSLIDNYFKYFDMSTKSIDEILSNVNNIIGSLPTMHGEIKGHSDIIKKE